MPAAFFVRAVIKFHIEQGVGLQAFLCGNLIILYFPLPKCVNGGFLCCLDNLRVIPCQCTIDKFILYFCGFGLRCPAVADRQGRSIVKSDKNIACTPPFSRTGGRFNFAGRAAE